MIKPVPTYRKNFEIETLSLSEWLIYLFLVFSATVLFQNHLSTANHKQTSYSAPTDNRILVYLREVTVMAFTDLPVI